MASKSALPCLVLLAAIVLNGCLVDIAGVTESNGDGITNQPTTDGITNQPTTDGITNQPTTCFGGSRTTTKTIQGFRDEIVKIKGATASDAQSVTSIRSDTQALLEAMEELLELSSHLANRVEFLTGGGKMQKNADFMTMVAQNNLGVIEAHKIAFIEGKATQYSTLCTGVKKLREPLSSQADMARTIVHQIRVEVVPALSCGSKSLGVIAVNVDDLLRRTDDLISQTTFSLTEFLASEEVNLEFVPSFDDLRNKYPATELLVKELDFQVDLATQQFMSSFDALLVFSNDISNWKSPAYIENLGGANLERIRSHTQRLQSLSNDVYQIEKRNTNINTLLTDFGTQTDVPLYRAMVDDIMQEASRVGNVITYVTFPNLHEFAEFPGLPATKLPTLTIRSITAGKIYQDLMHCDPLVEEAEFSIAC